MSGFMDTDNGGGAGGTAMDTGAGGTAMDTRAGGSSAMEETVFFGATATAAMDTGATDVQDDYRLLLDGYPLITKFSPMPESEYGRKDFFLETMGKVRSDFYFILSFERTDVAITHIKITPVLEPGGGKASHCRYVFGSTKDPDPEYAKKLIGYIYHQIMRAGIIEALADVPLNSATDDLMFVLRRFQNAASDIQFHQDHTLFIMLNYYHKTNPTVIGSEILLGHKNPACAQHQLQTVGCDRFYSEFVGPKLATAYESIKDIYDPTILRSLLKNGDTYCWSDALLKHGIPDPKETVLNQAMMQITLKGKTRGSAVKDEVQICPGRIKTTPELTRDRMLICLFFFKNTQKYPTKDLGREIKILIGSIQPVEEEKTADFTSKDLGREIKILIGSIQPVEEEKTADFTSKDLENFINSIKNPEGCVTVGLVPIINKGGKKRRLMRSKTNKNKKVSKRKSKHNIYKKTHKAKSRH